MHIYNPDAAQTLNAATVPRKNFIDDAIFNRMAAAGIQSAPIASDVEFLRRVTLDLTGRIPSGGDVVAFMFDTNPSKRDAKIDALIGSPEFVDKWAMFFSDLYKVNAQSTSINRDVYGRDAFYLYVKDAISRNKPYDQMARERIAGQVSGAPSRNFYYITEVLKPEIIMPELNDQGVDFLR